MRVQTMVSSFLLGMGKASSNPVKLSMMVRMCWFPDMTTFWSVTKSIEILSKGPSGTPTSVMGTIAFLPCSFPSSSIIIR